MVNWWVQDERRMTMIEMTLQELYDEIKEAIFSLPEDKLVATARTLGLEVKPIKWGLFEVRNNDE